MTNIGNLQNKDGDLLFPYALLYEVVLYDNESGANGTITLNDSAANYKYIDIFFRNNDQQYNFTRIYKPNGKQVSLLTSFTNNETYHIFKSKRVTISGNQIITNGYAENNFVAASVTDWGNNTYIIRVVGYKK